MSVYRMVWLSIVVGFAAQPTFAQRIEKPQTFKPGMWEETPGAVGIFETDSAILPEALSIARAARKPRPLVDQEHLRERQLAQYGSGARFDGKLRPVEIGESVEAAPDLIGAVPPAPGDGSGGGSHAFAILAWAVAALGIGAFVLVKFRSRQAA